MAIAGGAMSSVHLTLIRGQLIEGGVMMRQSSVLVHTPQLAWRTLLEKGECHMALQGPNLAMVRELYAAWVFEQGKVTAYEQG